MELVNPYEIKLSYLKQIDKHNVYILHLTSYKLVDNEMIKQSIDENNLDQSSKQVFGIYLIPRRKHRKTVLAITPRKCFDIQKIYKKLDKINGLVDLTPSPNNMEHVKDYEEFKKEYYNMDIEELITQEFGK